MKKFTNIKNKIKTSNLAFLVLTISLFLSSVVISNDMGAYVDDTTLKSANDGTGSRAISIDFLERQMINFDPENVTSGSDPFQFCFEYTDWVSEYFDIKVYNMSTNNLYEWKVQKEQSGSDNLAKVPMYGCEYNDGTYVHKPQELGINVTLPNPSYLDYIELELSFHIVMNETYNNLVESKNMINNATIDIRLDNGNNEPGEETIRSIPLRDGVIDWMDPWDVDHVWDTIGHAIDEVPKDRMLSRVRVKFPINQTFETGNYWSVLNAKTSHDFNQTYAADSRIDIYFYNDSKDYSHFVYRTNDSNDYIADVYHSFQNPAFDMYNIIKRRVIDYTDPSEIEFRIAQYYVDSSRFVRIYQDSPDGAHFNTFTSSPEAAGLYFTQQTNVTANRTGTYNGTMSFQTIGSMTKWNGSIPLFDAHAKCHIKNTTFTIPGEWNINTLTVTDNQSKPLSYRVNGQQITVVNTTSTDIIYISILSENVISSITDFGDVLSIASEVHIRCDGTGTAPKLKVDLYCNGTFVMNLLSDSILNKRYTITIPKEDAPEGSGYKLKAYWDDGGLLIGYMESRSFAISHQEIIEEPDEEEPDKPNNEPNAMLPEIDLPTAIIWGAVVAVSAGAIFRAVKRNKNKVTSLYNVGVGMGDES